MIPWNIFGTRSRPGRRPATFGAGMLWGGRRYAWSRVRLRDNKTGIFSVPRSPRRVYLRNYLSRSLGFSVSEATS